MSQARSQNAMFLSVFLICTEPQHANVQRSLDDYMGEPDAKPQVNTAEGASDPPEAQLVQASVRAPLLRSRGLTLYYHDSIHGIPQALVQDIARTHCLAEMLIILTVRQVSHHIDELIL